MIGIGANLGDRLSSLRAALTHLGQCDGIVVERVAPVYESEAMVLEHADPQPAYLNTVVEVSTSLEPLELLDRLLEIESSLGRRREGSRWQPRTIDLDILLFGDRIISEPTLSIPHPGLRIRPFVLAPLADLAPEMRLPPDFTVTVREALESCPGTPAQAVDVLHLPISQHDTF
jgi:2-amino-4-hydroxy-6-hydroxymethyldihydropteridine diphosphokinase